MSTLKEEAVLLLQQLIRQESFSKAEEKSAEVIFSFMERKNIVVKRLLNNVFASNKYYDVSKPTILLNSHHDTVRPSAGYTRDPFEPMIEDGKLYGLGSNDAGGALVSLLACFLHFYERADLNFNLVYAASAEEEISGKNGIELLLPELGPIYLGIVGEPTNMNIAIAEKGLMVIDCTAHGIAGHAAREEGDNAIYKALKDIHWFSSFRFPNESDMLGPVKMSVTVLNAGTQHNVVPAACQFTVDIRTTDSYSNQEVLQVIEQHVDCDLRPRSLRLNPSFIPRTHPIVKVGESIGLGLFGSPTTSDQALMNFPTIKTGPGDSVRSHSANEFIFIREIEEAVEIYIQLLTKLNSEL